MTERTRGDSPTKTCTADDCGRPLRARGLCSMHWKREYRIRQLFTVTCIVCHEDHKSSRPGGKYCSDRCKGKHYESTKVTRCRLPIDHPVMVEILRLKSAGRCPPIPAQTRLWTSGPCAWCAMPFTTYTYAGTAPASYCSDTCKAKSGRARRRAHEAGADGTYTWAEVTRAWILIGKRCAYCGEAKRNDEIEPDHVVPISRGGSNSITNIVPACQGCNGDKRDLLLDDWYADRQRRGKSPRVLHALLSGLSQAAWGRPTGKSLRPGVL